MTLLGLSILVASISFLCYRHPPFSWARFLLMRGSPPKTTSQEKTAHLKPRHDGRKEEVHHAEQTNVKEELDRKAMPPPSFVLQKSLLNPPPPAQSSPMPTTAPAQLDISLPPIPLFPAANSAQRATGGRTSQLRPPASQRLLGSSSSTSLAPPPTHTSIPTKPRQKVLLSPGHSPLDWARLTSSPNANLRGLSPSTPYLRVPPSLLRKNNGRKGSDVWMAIGGKVYNITPYLPYHPGGVPELMKSAGRDGTKLFGEVHPWVNWEGMLESCLVGVAVAEEEGGKAPRKSLEQLD